MGDDTWWYVRHVEGTVGLRTSCTLSMVNGTRDNDRRATLLLPVDTPGAPYEFRVEWGDDCAHCLAWRCIFPADTAAAPAQFFRNSVNDDGAKTLNGRELLYDVGRGRKMPAVKLWRQLVRAERMCRVPLGSPDFVAWVREAYAAALDAAVRDQRCMVFFARGDDSALQLGKRSAEEAKIEAANQLLRSHFELLLAPMAWPPKLLDIAAEYVGAESARRIARELMTTPDEAGFLDRWVDMFTPTSACTTTLRVRGIAMLNSHTVDPALRWMLPCEPAPSHRLAADPVDGIFVELAAKDMLRVVPTPDAERVPAGQLTIIGPLAWLQHVPLSSALSVQRYYGEAAWVTRSVNMAPLTALVSMLRKEDPLDVPLAPEDMQAAGASSLGALRDVLAAGRVVRMVDTLFAEWLVGQWGGMEGCTTIAADALADFVAAAGGYTGKPLMLALVHGAENMSMESATAALPVIIATHARVVIVGDARRRQMPWATFFRPAVSACGVRDRDAWPARMYDEAREDTLRSCSPLFAAAMEDRPFEVRTEAPEEVPPSEFSRAIFVRSAADIVRRGQDIPLCTPTQARIVAALSDAAVTGVVHIRGARELWDDGDLYELAALHRACPGVSRFLSVSGPAPPSPPRPPMSHKLRSLFFILLHTTIPPE